MSTVAVTDLLQQAFRHADMEALSGEQFVSDDEMLVYLNHAKNELDYKLLGLNLVNRTETLQEITPDALTLPVDYNATVSVYCREVNSEERFLLKDIQLRGANGACRPVGYRIVNGGFEFFPRKEMLPGFVVEHYYLAEFPRLSLTAGPGVTTSVYYPQDWWVFITLKGAKYALAKEETVNPVIESLLGGVEDRIEREAVMRHQSQNFKIAPIRNMDGFAAFRNYNYYDPADWRNRGQY